MSADLAPLTPLLVVFCGVLGLLIGSFLNVVVYRVPAGLSVNEPRRSFCPLCKEPIAARDNLPVLSWLLLRGKCRSCKAPISKRYPLVEAGTGAVFAVTAAHTGFSIDLLPLLAFSAVAIPIALIDLDTQKIIVGMRWLLTAVTVVSLVVVGLVQHDWPWQRTLLAAGLFLASYGLPFLITVVLGRRAMGIGDVKLAPTLGLLLGWFGWGPVAVGLLAGFWLGAFVGVAMMLLGSAGRKTALPFAPFMIVGTWIGLFAGPAVWTWYLHTFGLVT